MSNSFVTNSESTLKSKFEFPMVSLSERQQALDLLPKLMARLAPQWPLRNFVAVNPLHGYNDMSLLQAMQELQRVREAELLMPLAHYRNHLASGKILEREIFAACTKVRESFEVLFEAYGVRDEEIYKTLVEVAGSTKEFAKEYRTFAEQVGYAAGICWQDMIVEEISRHCSAYYAEGESAWPQPYKQRGLYAAWQAVKQVDLRMEWLGIQDFRKSIRELPETPVDCIVALLGWFEIPQKHWRGFLLTQWNSIVGWASYIQGKQFGVNYADLDENDLVGLLAIRLAYDACLAQRFAGRQEFKLWPEATQTLNADSSKREQLVSDLSRYVGLVACETRYRQDLRKLLTQRASVSGDRREVGRTQMIFCIDVRSEVLRRQIEDVSPDIETLGFAGFFGLPFQLHSSESDGSSNQCPVLLIPKFDVHETCGSNDCGCANGRAEKKSQPIKTLFEQLGSSAVACFGYVEALGVTYLPKMVQRMLPTSFQRQDKMALSDDRGQQRAVVIKKPIGLSANLDLSQSVALAKGILQNLGLKKRLGSLVVFVGHGSQSTNNPFQASLDCGACGGHSGESNARMAAQLLNNPEVRKAIREEKIELPEECWFMAALHNTTTDEIIFFEEEGMPLFARDELEVLRTQLPAASKRAQEERNLRFGNPADESVYRRALDWSEVRPEWGLVNNSAFIAAPREFTKGLCLDGRVFLHSYDPAADDDGSVLELILTAPVVVAHWINTQYYFSTVDPNAFGSGNKVLHSVVGGVGVVEGNGGDLKTGLPWQSVHDGQRFQHEPLRLSVVLYAKPEAIDRVIERHVIVQNLVRNGWIHISAWDGDGLQERVPEGGWSKAC